MGDREFEKPVLGFYQALKRQVSNLALFSFSLRLQLTENFGTKKVCVLLAAFMRNYNAIPKGLCFQKDMSPGLSRLQDSFIR